MPEPQTASQFISCGNEALDQILDGFKEVLRAVQTEDAKTGRINSPSATRLARQIGTLADWAAEQPTDAPCFTDPGVADA